MFHTPIKKSIIVSLIFSIFFLFTGTFNKTNAQAYRGLVIDQFKYEIEDAKKGQSYPLSFTVTHDFEDHNKVVTIELRAKDFTSNGIDGTPNFLEYGELANEASLASWITFEKSQIILDHYQQVETINFTITIPENAEPGGKYAAVLLADNEGEKIVDISDEQAQLGLNKELGPLILLTVEGEITKGLQANDLFTTNLKGNSYRFYFNPPINIIAEIQNTGNTHTSPVGAIYLYKGNDFQESIAKFELNPDQNYILPNSSRIYSNIWNESFIETEVKVDEEGKVVTDDKGKTKYTTKYNWDQLSKLRMGRYNVKLLYNTETADGQVGTLEMNTYFWMFPWQILVIIGAYLIYLYVKYKAKENEKQKKIAEKKGDKAKKI